MIEKKIILDMIQVTENNCIQIRTKTSVMDDGVEIVGEFHRYVIVPGDDYSAENAKVQVICNAIHTPEVVASYQAEQAKIAAETLAQIPEIPA